MKVSAVNGFSRVNVETTPANGFSRVNYSNPANDLALNALMLNALNDITLNAIDDMTEDEFEDYLYMVDFGDDIDGDEVNGLFSRIKEGVQKRRARRKDRRAARQERRKKRRAVKDTRLQARLERLKSKAESGGKGLLDRVAGMGEKFLESKIQQGGEMLDEFGDDYDLADEEPDSPFLEEGAQKGLFKPDPFSKRWFEKHSPWSYVGTAAGGLIIIDLVSGGKVRKALGMKK